MVGATVSYAIVTPRIMPSMACLPLITFFDSVFVIGVEKIFMVIKRMLREQDLSHVIVDVVVVVDSSVKHLHVYLLPADCAHLHHALRKLLHDVESVKPSVTAMR